MRVLHAQLSTSRFDSGSSIVGTPAGCDARMARPMATRLTLLIHPEQRRWLCNRVESGLEVEHRLPGFEDAGFGGARSLLMGRPIS